MMLLANEIRKIRKKKYTDLKEEIKLSLLIVDIIVYVESSKELAKKIFGAIKQLQQDYRIQYRYTKANHYVSAMSKGNFEINTQYVYINTPQMKYVGINLSKYEQHDKALMKESMN
jgi:hypothetical protein